jgi:hypothetical protein
MYNGIHVTSFIVQLILWIYAPPPLWLGRGELGHCEDSKAKIYFLEG